MPRAEPIRIYTDGACSGNPGPGGWAWASSAEHFNSGGEAATTNNRMELTAVLRAIEDNPSGPLVIVMDSTYVKDGLEKWSRNWVRNDWRTKDKKPVKNQDLWKPLVEARDSRSDLAFEWVKGHSGDRMNDLVDALAVERRDEQRGAEGGSVVPSASTSPGAGRLTDLAPAEQRAERRRRDGRIPDGHLLLVVGHSPPELGGWEPNQISDSLRDRLVDLVDGYANITPDLVVLTGLRPGAEQLAAEAAIKADVAYVAVLPFADPDRNLGPAQRARFRDLMGRARSVVQLEKKSPADRDEFAKAMRRRDTWLANAADQAILVWNQTDDRFDRLFSDLDRRLGAELTVLHP